MSTQPISSSAASEPIHTQVLPREITSLDILKSLAVIIMVIDHLGAYFFPDLLWLRAIGRTGFPIWFFLAGYSSGRGIPNQLIIGAAILVAGDVVVGLSLLPLNALFTIMAIRLLIDPLMKPVIEKRLSIWVIALLLVLAIYPSNAVVEYGAMGMITSIFGYLVRKRDIIQDEKLITHYMFFSLITFVVLQQILFSFTIPQIVVVTVGTLAVRMWLLNLKRVSYPELSAKLPAFIVAPIKFMGRRTLEIYVAHLMLFKFIALALLLHKT